MKEIRKDINGLVKTEFAEVKDSIKGLRRELRRIRHSPPPAAYSDDDMPAAEGRTSKGTKSHQGVEQ